MVLVDLVGFFYGKLVGEDILVYHVSYGCFHGSYGCFHMDPMVVSMDPMVVDFSWGKK